MLQTCAKGVNKGVRTIRYVMRVSRQYVHHADDGLGEIRRARSAQCETSFALRGLLHRPARPPRQTRPTLSQLTLGAFGSARPASAAVAMVGSHCAPGVCDVPAGVDLAWTRRQWVRGPGNVPPLGVQVSFFPFGCGACLERDHHACHCLYKESFPPSSNRFFFSIINKANNQSKASTVLYSTLHTSTILYHTYTNNTKPSPSK